MKTRLLPHLILIAVFLAACAPAATPVSPVLPVTGGSTATFPPPTSTPEVTEALQPTPLAIATSRGPNLEATDPSSVSLASGQLQLVEFFRFT